MQTFPKLCSMCLCYLLRDSIVPWKIFFSHLRSSVKFDYSRFHTVNSCPPCRRTASSRSTWSEFPCPSRTSALDKRARILRLWGSWQCPRWLAACPFHRSYPFSTRRSPYFPKYRTVAFGRPPRPLSPGRDSSLATKYLAVIYTLWKRRLITR